MWTKSQAQAKFLTAAATMRFLIARPPSRLPGDSYYGDSAAALRRGSATGILDEEDEDDVLGTHKTPPSPLLLVGESSGDRLPLTENGGIDGGCGGSSPRSRDSGNMSIDSDDKSFEIQRNRLSSSSSSKDGSGGGGGGGSHRSGDSIDRSTTNSSKSEASSHDGTFTRIEPENNYPAVSVSFGSADLKKSQSLFSIDSDFMFVSTKQQPDRNNEEDDRQTTIMIRGNNQPMIVRKDCLNSINNNINANSGSMIDPIYEIIHEQSEPEADMYCLPVDSVMTSSSAKPVLPAAAKMASPEHVAKKTRSRSSDQVKLLAKSTSGIYLQHYFFYSNSADHV
jgi:hypothetical protein